MAFEPKNFVRISAGEVASDQLGGNIDFCYESTTDDIGTAAGQQGGPDYFNDIYKLVRYGSIIKCIYKEPDFVNFDHELYWVDSNNPSETTVILGAVHTPSPSPFYEIMGDDDGVFGCMTLLGCEDYCPKDLPHQTQIAYLRKDGRGNIISKNRIKWQYSKNGDYNHSNKKNQRCHWFSW